MDLFERFEETQRFIDPFWVNSHMAEQEFKTKFGEQNHWRRILNALVDEEVGKRANQERNLHWKLESRPKKRWRGRLTSCLLKGCKPLLSYDKDQGPLVRWVEKPGKPEPKQRQVANQQSSQPKQAGKTTGKSGGGAPIPERSQIKQKAETGRSPERGPGSKNHEWQECHRSRDNLTAKCKKCGMYIQQVDKPANFEEKITHTMLEVWIAGPPKADFTLLTNPATVGWRGFVWGAGLRKT